MFTKHELEQIGERLSYDRETGVIARKKPYGNRPLGTVSDGYLYIKIFDRRVAAHRLAWFLGTGSMPLHDIDHINGNRLDNRFENLRDVPRRTNQENKRPTSQSNKTGYMGVYAHYGKWRAKIQVGGRTVLLGIHATPEAAHEAYLQAKRQLHAGCTI